jgi:hypothetical protein
MVQLRKLEVFFGLKASKTREQVLKTMGERLGPTKDTLLTKTKKGTVSKRISASVLPHSSEANHYAHFHIDDYRGSNEEKDSPLFVHVTYRQQPSSPPPQPFVELKELGITVEWLDDQLRALVGTSKLFVMFEAEGTAPKAEKRLPVAAPPIVAETTLLRCTGVEYRSETGEIGLNSFRWSRKGEEKLDVFFAYSQEEVWRPVNLWVEEAERCTKFLDSLP